jgi:hypothetical protein
MTGERSRRRYLIFQGLLRHLWLRDWKSLENITYVILSSINFKGYDNVIKGFGYEPHKFFSFYIIISNILPMITYVNLYN